MSISITIRQSAGVTIVAPSGRLIFGEGVQALRARIADLALADSPCVLLDLADVVYIDSSGIGELVYAHSVVKALRGELKLVNMGRRVQDLLKIMRLDTVFEVYEDEPSAIADFVLEKSPQPVG